jgi:hypothetical protein
MGMREVSLDLGLGKRNAPTIVTGRISGSTDAMSVLKVKAEVITSRDLRLRVIESLGRAVMQYQK